MAIRAILMLALGVCGVVDIVARLAPSWRWLVEALLLGLLAPVFFMAATRSRARRFSWLLSASVASGLAIAAGYTFVSTGTTTLVAATSAVILIAILLLLTWGAIRERLRR